MTEAEYRLTRIKTYMRECEKLQHTTASTETKLQAKKNAYKFVIDELFNDGEIAYFELEAKEARQWEE